MKKNDIQFIENKIKQIFKPVSSKENLKNYCFGKNADLYRLVHTLLVYMEKYCKKNLRNSDTYNNFYHFKEAITNNCSNEAQHIQTLCNIGKNICKNKLKDSSGNRKCNISSHSTLKKYRNIAEAWANSLSNPHSELKK